MLKILRARLEIIKLLREWMYWAKRIANAARNILGDCEVYVFGSVVEGRATGGSDVDILIIADRLPRRILDRCAIKVRIEEEAGLPWYHPFEIHLVDRREASWYMRYIRKKVKIG